MKHLVNEHRMPSILILCLLATAFQCVTLRSIQLRMSAECIFTRAQNFKCDSNNYLTMQLLVKILFKKKISVEIVTYFRLNVEN